jgi:hypothetical protein
MAEHMIELTEEQEKAGLAILGSVEAVTAELQRICDYTANPWVLKATTDAAAAAEAEAVALKTKYDALPPEKKEQVDAIIATAAEGQVEP